MGKTKKYKSGVDIDKVLQDAEDRRNAKKSAGNSQKSSRPTKTAANKPDPNSTTEQLGRVRKETLAKADKGTKPTYKTKDAMADEYDFPGTHVDVSDRMFKKKKKSQ